MRELDDVAHGRLRGVLDAHGLGAGVLEPDRRVIQTHKQCAACAKEGLGPLPVDQFHRNKSSPDGIAYQCIRHAHATSKRSYLKHAEEVSIRRARRYASRGQVISKALQKWGVPRCA